MNIRSHFSQCLPCLQIPSQTGAERNVNHKVQLPEYTYTYLSLKALERQSFTNSSIITAWDRAKSSNTIRILDNEPTRLRRDPASFDSTEIAMSDTGFSKGIHVLDVVWPLHKRGSRPVIGVALEGTPNRVTGSTNLLGSTESSWGWNLKNNKLFHNGQTIGNYPEDKSDSEFIAPQKISCIIDMNAGTLGFKADEKYLGDAFSGLRHKTVFLAVSVTHVNTEIEINYNKGFNANTPLSLQDLTKLSLRRLVKFEEQLAVLPTAPSLKRFIADKEMTNVNGKDKKPARRVNNLCPWLCCR